LHLDATSFTPPPEAQLLTYSKRAVNGAAIASFRLLNEYDSYYYDRKYKKPLPVLEVKLADSASTWFYIDLASGLPVNRYESSGRWERWLYHGLHSLDFPGLWNRRPLWDIVVILVSLGGIFLSYTGVRIALRRLRFKTRRKAVSSPPSAQSQNQPAYVEKA
jgi:hypothetical protein